MLEDHAHRTLGGLTAVTATPLLLAACCSTDDGAAATPDDETVPAARARDDSFDRYLPCP